MQRPRFLDFRGHTDIGRLGLCQANIPDLAGLVNEATENLLFDPLAPEDGWWGGWGRFVFTLSQAQPYIVAPRGVARLILLDVCQRPVRIQNGFYEFLDFGYGLQPKTACGSGGACGGTLQAYDREGVPVLGTLSGPATIRTYPSDSADVGKRVIIGGEDNNGKTIYSTDPLTGAPIEGEIVVLDQPFVDSLNQYTGISGVQKDATSGPLSFFQVNAATGAQTALSTMEPSETAGNYRRYLVNGLPTNCPCSPTGVIQVNALGKLDFVPVQSDPDYLVIPNVPALIAECESIRLGKGDSKNAYAMGAAKHQRALQLLFGQLDHFLGKDRPAITLPIFGSAKLRSSFV